MQRERINEFINRWNLGKEKHMDTGKKKSMAAVICIFLIFVTFASLFYIAREENHNCTGKDCPICACVHQAKQVLRNLGTTPAADFRISLVTFISEVAVLLCFWVILSISLVHQKVRLND